MVEAGLSEKVAMELSGHLTRTIFENYHIVSTDDLRKAVEKVSVATAGPFGIPGTRRITAPAVVTA
jgi:hypothetical protein